MSDTASLTRFQRLLLGTDGTVTHILEAYAGETMEVVKLLQVSDVSKDGDADLLLDAGEKVLRRRVVLRGRLSRTNFLYAEAVVVLGRVQPSFLDRLAGTDKPIGVLLAEDRTETFREILHVGREPAGSCGAHFGVDTTDELLSRTYRIVVRQQPVILITERFPPEFFRGLPA